jgi:hypothetical protein
MAKRDASCPLCGAKMVPAQVLDACEEIVDEHLGVLGCQNTPSRPASSRRRWKAAKALFTPMNWWFWAMILSRSLWKTMKFST